MTTPVETGRGVVRPDSIHLLHVDDDPSFTDLVSTFLTREDDRLDVDTATNVEEALDRLDTGAFDCIVSDYGMPGRDGIDLLEAVRDTYPDLPFIVYTGKGSEDVASDAFSAGATDYLQKESGTDQYALLANKVTNYAEKYATERKTRRRARAMETADDGIAIVDPDGRYTEVNAAYATLYESTPEAMVGTPWTVTVPEDETDRLRREAFPVLDDGESWAGESVGRRADGSTYPKLLSLAPLDDGGHVCVVRDITERKEREREARRYDRMVNAMREAVCVYDAAGRFEIVNDYLADFYGMEPSELEGTESRLIRRLREEASGSDPYRELLDGERDQLRGEIAGEFPGYGEAILDYRLTAFPDESGDGATGAVGVARDITERKERERDRRRYERVVEASGDPVYMLDPDGHFTFINDRFAEKMGYARADLIGEHVSVLMDEADIEAGERLIHSLLTGDDDRATFEMDAVTADGERLVCESHVALVMTGDEFRGTVGIIRDITDRKARERQLERQNERLEQFANIVSHDLQSPLNVVQGRLELAREDCESDHLDGATAALDRCQRLVDDLLAITREDVDANELAPVALDELAADCWRNVRTVDATLEITAERTVRANPTRFQRLLENLIKNSVEHGSDGVTVTVGELDDGGGFYVEDDGPGIPEAKRDRVLDPGYSTTTDGTGFGLSIVQTVADTHGWDVVVTEGTDGGARFEIRDVGD